MNKREITIPMRSLAGKTLNLGYVGENLHTRIIIDCTEELCDYPNATINMAIRSPHGDIYPVLPEKDGWRAIWDVTGSDLVYAGSGQIQVTLMDGEEIIKSAIGNFTTSASLETTGPAPEPLQNWMDAAEQTAAQIAEDAAEGVVDDLADAKDEAIAAIEAKGEEVIEEIPADYTQLSEDVSNVKSAISDVDAEIKNGLNEAAGINIKKFAGYQSKRYDITSAATWQSASYCNITNFPVKNGDTIVCGCKELRQFSSSVGEIRVFNSANTRIKSSNIPATAKNGNGFKYQYTIDAEGADHLTVMIYGVGNVAPTVGDYSNIEDAYCMIAQAEISANNVFYDANAPYSAGSVGQEIKTIDGLIAQNPLKSIVNLEDIVLYRDRVEYIATGSGTWQGGYQIDITIPATENDTIYVYCDGFNTYGRYFGSCITKNENGDTIYSHYFELRTKMLTNHLASVKLDAGTVAARIMLALISSNFDDNVPSAGDIAYVNHLVFFKNGVSIKPFVSLAAIDEMDKSTIYSLPSEWRNKIQDIQNAQNGKFTFAVQTDTHFGNIGTGIYTSSYNDLMNNLSKLTEYIGFDFVCNLGDIIRGYDADTTDDMLEAYTELMHRYVTNLRCPLLVTPGNHDTNRMYADAQSDASYQISKGTMYSKLIPFVKNSTPQAVFNGRSLYYYVDFEDSGIRAIFLNTTDGEYSDSTVGSTFIISQEQLTWFSTEALNTDKAIMIFCHVPLVDGLTTNTVTNHAAVMNSVYSFKNNGGTVVGCFYGHTHKQDSKVDENNILHVTFTFGGTCTEVVIVDTDQSNRVINTIGIGTDTSGKAVENRSFTY